MSLQEIKERIPTLTFDERRELLHVLIDTFTESPPRRKRSLRELRGLGKEIWEGVDVQSYINEQRDEWDDKS